MTKNIIIGVLALAVVGSQFFLRQNVDRERHAASEKAHYMSEIAEDTEIINKCGTALRAEMARHR